MKKVLIIEDDPDIIDLVALHLEDMDCQAQKVMNGTDGLALALEGNFDLVILDLMLPGLDGIAICQRMRAMEIHTPVLMLTARSEEFDKVLGLESGADDYLTKPFGIRELKARVKALLRRDERVRSASSEVLKLIEHGSMRIDLLQDGEKVLFENNNTGPGIPEEDIPHLFERYYRSRAKDAHGSGLGLAIVK